MEHFVIFIYNGSLTEEDQVSVTNNLNALFPNLLQYHNIALHLKEIALLLRPCSKYLVILNASRINEYAEWNKIEDSDIDDIVANEVKVNSNQELSSVNDIEVEQLSACLHSLADQLPAFGTYKLDVLLGSDVLGELSVSKQPDLAGAFIRLSRWHSAYFSIIEQKEYNLDKLNEWCEIINARVFHKNYNLDLSPPLWRGAIVSNTADKSIYQGFELKLTNEEWQNMPYPAQNILQESSEHIVISSNLQVINEVYFNSIPPYLISPVSFQLYFSKLHLLNRSSFNFISNLLSSEESALIMRLEYAELNGNLKANKKYCTDRWYKAIMSDNLRDPKCFVSSFEKFITFIVTKSKVSDHIIAYPLQETSLDARFYFNIINQRLLSLPYHVNKQEDEDRNSNILAEVPFIENDPFKKLLLKHTDFKEEHFIKGLPSFLEEIKNFATSSSVKRNSFSDLLLEETDPSDWPERIQLLQKQMKNEAKECVPSNSTSIGPNLKSSQLSFSFTSDIITQYFLPSGELKNSMNAEHIHSLKTPDQTVVYDFDAVMNATWPKIMNCMYHDLYYNANYQNEGKENLGSEMVKLYVLNETASICSNQQITQNFSIIVSEKGSTPSKEFRSPSTRAANTFLNKKREKNYSSPKVLERIDSLKELISKKIVSSRMMHVENAVSINNNVASCKTKRNLSKCAVPVRSSPRKKSHVNYKYPSTKRNTNVNKNDNTRDSNKISDVLRKKIRFAVATALENNGINMSHAFFKPCGSKLFSICLTFLDDLALKKKKTSEYLQKIADAHVKQVIEFYQD